MKIKQLFYGVLTSGKVTWDDPAAVKNEMLKLGDTDIQVLFEKRKKTRSVNQNAYYWGVVIALLCEELGWMDKDGKDEMHEYLKSLFLKKYRGEIVTVRSTTSLDTGEFEDYLSAVRSWASIEHGCYIPLPHEVPGFDY
jgi:hypothetical protein